MLPILVFLMVGIIDLARVYTTMLSVESAAREAADYGSFGSQKWAPAPAVAQRQTEMRARLRRRERPPRLRGSRYRVHEPIVRIRPVREHGRYVATQADYAAMACDNATRPTACWVSVTLTYQFHCSSR